MEFNNNDNNFLKSSYSKDKISFIYRDGTKFVRKSSNGEGRKLISAALIQASYRPNNQRIRVVPIRTIVSDCGHSEVEMPFIFGYSGEDIYTQLGPKEIISIGSEMIDEAISNFKYDRNIKADYFISEIIAKIDSIKLRLKSSNYEAELLPFHDKIVHKVREILNQKDLCIPQGVTHGDFTFSNTIVDTENTIWLIDFLDFPIKSPLVDLAKLIQEFKFNWSARHLGRRRLTHANICGNELMGLLETKTLTPWKSSLQLMSLVNLYRIAPYVKDRVTSDWLVAALQSELK